MIRVCPERDSRCPHGMKCPFVKDRYQCKEGWDGKEKSEQTIFTTCRKEPVFTTCRV